MSILGDLRSRSPGAAVIAALILAALAPGASAATTSGGWTGLGHGSTPTNNALNDKVETLYNVGTTVYVGGDFTDAGGIASADRIAKWNGSAWSAVGGGITGGAVYSIAVDGTKVYAGGSAQFAGGAGNGRIAVWNGSSWGSLGHSLNGNVNALAIVGRTMYIGGAFSDAADLPNGDAIVAYGLDSGAWSAITPGSGDISGTIAAIAPDALGGIYVCGSFLNAVGDDSSDYVVYYRAGVWSSLGSDGADDGALENRCRGLAVSGNYVYAVGDFINVSGTNQADKIARYNVTTHTWSTVGAPAFFGAGVNSLYGITVDGPRLFVAGSFLNAGGLPRVDGLAAFSGGTWKNVGTNADGTNGPAAGSMRSLVVVGSKLYAGGWDGAIGGGPQNSSAAFYRLRQPDGQIATTAAFIGNNVYNGSGGSQTKSLTTHRGSTGTFRIKITNDGFASDSFKVKGPGSGGGFTATYKYGATNITSQVVAGTYPINSLAPGASRTVILSVRVGSGVAVGATRSWLVQATSTGLGAARDTVKATVRAS